MSRRIQCDMPRSCHASAITEIHRQGLATGQASFNADPHDWSSFERTYFRQDWMALIARHDEQVLGWAGVASVSDRCVYEGVGEVSVYVGAAARQGGVGHALLQAIVELSEDRGYWTLMAQIFPENTASIALHTACGFQELGRRKRIGRMSHGPLCGQWRDTVLLERRSDRVGVD